MKFLMDKEDILKAVQTYVCEVVGEDKMVSEIVFSNAGGGNVSVTKIEISYKNVK